MTVKIKSEWNGYEIKKILFSELKLSSAMVTKLKKLDCGILLDGIRVTVRQKVCENQMLYLHTDDVINDVNPHIMPCFLPLDIIYEDENIVAVNKPSGMPTVPTHGHRDDTLANALAYYYKDSGKPFVFRPVNRLDRETSGTVLIAKNKIACDFCSKELVNHGFVKKYIAVCKGKPETDKGTIKGYIKRCTPSIITRKLENEGYESEYSETDYEVIKSNGNLSLMLLSPKTGKTHQIRVHLLSIGLPIIGDTLYSVESELIDRCALHSYSLEITLPFSEGKRIEFKADIPNDMKKIIDIIY